MPSIDLYAASAEIRSWGPRNDASACGDIPKAQIEIFQESMADKSALVRHVLHDCKKHLTTIATIHK